MDTGIQVFIGFSFLIIIVILVLVFHYVRKQKQTLNDVAAALGTDKISSGHTYKGELDGVSYYYEYFGGSKNNPSYFQVWLDCESSGEFSITEEGKFDQFFKKIGIAVEIQTGDKSFDQNFYIHTDSVAYTNQYLMDYDKRDMIRKLFELGYSSVEHDGTNMRVKTSPCSLDKLSDLSFVENAVRHLQVLSQKLPAEIFETRVFGAPAWKAKRNLLYTIAVLSLVIGLAGLIWGFMVYTPMDGMDLFLYGLEFAIPAFIIFIVISVIFLKGRSSSHKELMFVFFLVLVGFPLGAFGGLTVLNGYLDKSESQDHDVKTFSKRISKSKNSSNYYVTIESWREGNSDEEIKIDNSTYRKIKPEQTTMRISSRHGKFNFEWIASYRILKK